MMKCGFAVLSLFSIKIEYLTSIFAIPCSIFVKIEYLTSIFAIPCSIFVIRFFRVSFYI
jgi:hypothetical protein